jgi:hypothetical protein
MIPFWWSGGGGSQETLMLVLLWLPTVSTVTDCGGALGAAEEIHGVNTDSKSWCALMLSSDYEYKDKMCKVLDWSSSKSANSIQQWPYCKKNTL